MRKKAYSILKNTFGYDSFREKQEEVILNILNKKDTLAVMPTGSGKSLCYQIPALVFEGLTVVVSPLISLMQDQVEQLQATGVEAVLLNSSISRKLYHDNIQKIKSRQAKLLYVAPETLLKDSILEILSTIQVDCFTIDEAHCISEWGHDFRPEYRQLKDVRSQFPNAVCVALTATATERVRNDIQKNLTVIGNDFHTVVTSFDRKNLFLEIADKKAPYEQAVEFIRKFPDQSGIIYCFSRKQVDELSAYLDKLGLSVKPYHAGLSESERAENQRLFIRDEVQIVVATIAFGMGINKPNVRFVLHFDLPKNIESYYQEIGRAGRDGLDAHCLLLFSYGDIRKIRYFINEKSEEEQRVANMHLNALVGLAESYDCRRVPMLKYFGENPAIENCGFCDNCTEEKKELQNITIEAQKFLSCVARTGEVFGAGYIIDVLRGSKSQKVKSNNHQTLSTFNIGSDYSKAQWGHMARQFIRQQLVIQDGEYGSLKLTPKAYQCFKGQIKVEGTIKEEAKKEYQSKKSHQLNYDSNFYSILRKKRKEIADSKNLAPYMVFGDKTLVEMAHYFPSDETSLLNIHGVGRAKLAEYGETFLAIIRTYCKENNISPKTSSKAIPKAPKKSSKKEPRYLQTGREFNQGKSINELAEELGVQINTIFTHLYNFVVDGNILKNSRVHEMIQVNDSVLEKAMKSFDDNGSHQLRPVFEDLGEAVGYDDLKVLRLYYLTR